MDLGLRERKKQKTKDELAAAALALFGSQGYEATTIDAISEAALVSRRTFFRYFECKEAALFPAREAQLARFRALLAEVHPGETALGAVRRACIAVGAEVAADREASVLVDDIVRENPSVLAYERKLDLDFEDAIAGAVIARAGKTKAARRRARILAAAAFGVIRAVLREWFEGRGKGDLIAAGHEAFDLLEAGFGPTTDRGAS